MYVRSLVGSCCWSCDVHTALGHGCPALGAAGSNLDCGHRHPHVGRHARAQCRLQRPRQVPQHHHRALRRISHHRPRSVQRPHVLDRWSDQSGCPVPPFPSQSRCCENTLWFDPKIPNRRSKPYRVVHSVKPSPCKLTAPTPMTLPTTTTSLRLQLCTLRPPAA